MRISGPAARAVAAEVFRSREPLRDRVATYGRIVASDGATLDRGLALWFAGPRSYTGEDLIELHVHGSPALARETLVAALAAGARAAGPGEFTRRAFLSGKLDLAQAEAVADAIAAEHRAGVRAAAANLGGGLGREIAELRRELGGIVEDLAAALDFPDEVPDPPRARLTSRLDAVLGRVRALGATWERGQLVREGISVVLVGPPNAGKSSLMNALLQADRALVSEVPGTTRDTIEETLALDGIVARLIDTAGLREATDALESAGIARTHAALSAATLPLVVIDATQPIDAAAADAIARTADRPRIVYFNKADRGHATFDARSSELSDAILGSTFDAATLATIRTAIVERATHGEQLDLSRPHLATARQAAAVLATQRSLEFALRTLAAGDPVDLVEGDAIEAIAALGELTGREAGDALVDAIFARFCIGK